MNGIQLLYRPSNNQCDWPNRVECGSRPACDANDENCHENHITTDRPPVPTVCEDIPCDHGDGFYPEGDCDQCFCQCVGGAHYEQCCEDGLVFNPAVNQCDWPENVNCGDGPDPDEPFDCPEADGFFEDQNNCMKYYECSNNVGRHASCNQSKLNIFLNVFLSMWCEPSQNVT